MERLMTGAAGPAAVRFALARLRPKLEHLLAKHHVQWEDAVPALEMIDTLEEMEEAIADPDAFIGKLMAAASLLAPRSQGASPSP